MKRVFMLFLAWSLFSHNTAFAEEEFHPQGTMLRKLERGGANLLLGGLEVLPHSRRPDHGQYIPPLFYALGQDAYYTVKRMLVGVYEIVTFPIPVPQDYLPVMEPEFVWQYPPRKRAKINIEST